MAISGLRDTSNFVTDQRPKNWREGILLLYPNGKMPLTAMTGLMAKKGTDDPEFNWWEKKLSTRRIQVNAAISNAVATIPVTNDARSVKQGDVLYSEQTGEIMLVSSDPGTDTSLTVLRGFAGSTATAINPAAAGTNPFLKVIGSAYEEGSMSPTGVNFDPTKSYNYTQIFRNTLEMTRTASKTRLRTGDAIREAKRECLELHGMDMEMAFWFGKKSEGVKDGKPIRTTSGVFDFIDPGNVVTADTATGTDMDTWEEYLYRAFKFGSQEKVGICGNRALLTLNQIVRKNSTMQITPGLKEFGMNVTRLTSPFGEIVLKTHPLWNESAGGTTGGTPYYGMESWLAILDMAEFKYVPLTDSDTKYEADLAANGLDGMKSGYITEAGLEVHHPLTHFLIKNLAKPKKDA